MSISIPIEVPLARPLVPPESPYRKCGICAYVGIGINPPTRCPSCGQQLSGVLVWPDVELVELWHEQVFCWNERRAELGAIVAAMYFEASWFNLMYWGTSWLHPKLNWLGATFGNLKQKEEAIWKHLNTLNNRKKMNEALVEIFGVDDEAMLKTVLAGDALPFVKNYLLLKDHRNKMTHRGTRVYYQTIPAEDQIWRVQARDDFLAANLTFIPQCWEVFARLWNQYVHEPMLAKHKLGQI